MAMVYAQELGDWDYTGMYTAVLRRRVRRCSLLARSLSQLSSPLSPGDWFHDWGLPCIRQASGSAGR